MRLEWELKNSTWAKSPLMKPVSIKEDVGALLDLSGHEICVLKIGCDLGGHDIRFSKGGFMCLSTHQIYIVNFFFFKILKRILFFFRGVSADPTDLTLATPLIILLHSLHQY